jgi:hypothetical protein
MNKFFDPLMDYIEEIMFQSTISFEHDLSINYKNYYKKKRVIDISRLIFYYRFKHKRINFKSSIIDDVVDIYSQKLNLNKNDLEKKINLDLNEVFLWKKLWADILNITKPEFVFTLCYYNPKLFGLILAANEQNISTIDIQHGGQGKYQPCYYFKNYKFSNALPKKFWVWDSTSKISLEKSFSNKEHEIIIGGNPWVTYLNQNLKQKISENRRIILHSLQPGFKKILADQIIDSIKNTEGEYVWYLRLHPRMTEGELKIVKDLVINNNLEEKVEIDLASSLPLPIIIKNTFAHISYYSGILIEANLCNVPINIVIDQIGADTYSEYINSGAIKYIDLKDNINYFKIIKDLENKIKSKFKESIKSNNYESILENFV